MEKRKTLMPLRRVVSKIPGNQEVVVSDYITQKTYLIGDVNHICNELDYNMELRNSEVYGISYSTDAQAIVIEVIEE